jgi:hypothetical protein
MIIPYWHENYGNEVIHMPSNPTIVKIHPPSIESPLMDVELRIDGPTASHRLLCWHCQEHSAVYDLNTDQFRPCWECCGFYVDADRLPIHTRKADPPRRLIGRFTALLQRRT